MLGNLKPLEIVLILLVIVVLSSVLPYLWNSWALARTEASKVAFYVFLQPLLASVLAVLVLGETFAPRTLAAAALIFAGLAVAVAGRRDLLVNLLTDRAEEVDDKELLLTRWRLLGTGFFRGADHA